MLVEVGVAAALAVAVHRALDEHGALGDRGERVGHAALGVVVAVDADAACRARRRTARTARGDVGGQRGAVGVAQRDVLGAGLGRGAQARERVRRGRRASRRRSARRRRSRACPRATRNAIESAIIARFSSRPTLHDLLQVQAPGLADQRADRRERLGERRAAPGRPRARASRRRVMPKAHTSARRPSCSSRSNSSASFGFEAGKPASMNGTPSSSSRCATRTFSSTDSDMPWPCIPSRRVVS